MERIAPLAKILAEANGIEWDHLQGTGPGGQIVEQDILDYLTRVMSGEAEPPSTPVDAPPPDWDGNDVPGAGMFDAAALSKAGVESDIAEFVSQGRPAGGGQIPGMNTPALETSDFELDDNDQSLMAAPATAPSPVQPSTPVQPSAPTAPVDEPAPAPAATAAAGAGLGSLLSRLYHKDDAAPAAAAPATPTPSVETPTQPLPRVDIMAEPEPTPAPKPQASAPVQQAAPAVTPTPVVEPAPVVSAPVVEPAPKPAPQPATPAPAPAAPTPAPAPAAVSTPAAPTYSGPTSEVPRDAVWFGTYLRRDANVGTLTDLRGQLAEALERDVPLALLVARAAGRHLDVLGMKNVAMQDIGNNKALSVGAGSSSGIRDAVAAIDSDYDGTPDLLVVDAGSMELDDLHYPHTLTLSVGRVQGGKASLSLQGEVEPAEAAQFLAKVADTLEKPVILLV